MGRRAYGHLGIFIGISQRGGPWPKSAIRLIEITKTASRKNIDLNYPN